MWVANNCVSGDAPYFYFFPKNDIMFPCPGFALFFLALEAELGADPDLVFVGAGTSSSENDSHTGSSFVTIDHVPLATEER